MKRQGIAAVFLLIWLLAGSLPTLLLLEGKRQAKLEFALFKDQYKKANASVFQFTDSEYEKNLESKEEIRIQNQLFDIVSVKKTTNGVTVTCIPDNHENKLETAFADWNTNKNKKNGATNVKTFNPELRILNGPQILIYPVLFLVQIRNAQAFCINAVYLSKESPPPELTDLAFS